MYAMPRTAEEHQALWDAAMDTEHPVSAAERDQMFAALHLFGLAYICGFLPADALDGEQ
jgi:hypothetical protein